MVRVLSKVKSEIENDKVDGQTKYSALTCITEL